MFPPSQFLSLYFVHPEKLYILTTTTKKSEIQNHNKKCLAICLAEFQSDVPFQNSPKVLSA